MARIRTIKPSFFTSDDVSALPLRARLTWIGLWTHCDDQGRAKDHAKLIKAAVWPLDNVTLVDIEDDLTTLADHGRIVRYEVAGQRYLAVVNWHDHQTINRPTVSRLPAPPNGSAPAGEVPNTGAPEPRGTGREHDSLNTHAPLTEDSHGEGKGKEGKGREGTRAREAPPPTPRDVGPEPPSTCETHRDDPDPPPCGRCADARKAHERWASGALHAEQLARSQQARAQAEANRIAIAACRDCDPRGRLPNGQVCPHDPTTPDRARRGAAAARAALAAARPEEDP